MGMFCFVETNTTWECPAHWRTWEQAMDQMRRPGMKHPHFWALLIVWQGTGSQKKVFWKDLLTTMVHNLILMTEFVKWKELSSLWMDTMRISCKPSELLLHNAWVTVIHPQPHMVSKPFPSFFQKSAGNAMSIIFILKSAKKHFFTLFKLKIKILANSSCLVWKYIISFIVTQYTF